jgi:Fe-S cluster biogenesis protein NfuA
VTGHGVSTHGGTVIIARVSSSHGRVVMGAGGAPISCLLGEGRLNPPSPLEDVWNS